MKINKQNILEKIRSKVAEAAASLSLGAKNAHLDATNDESQQEDKYDTRGLEASYLAEAQAKLSSEIFRDLDIYNSLELKNFLPDEKISLTALVEVECNGRKLLYFIGPKSGGISIEEEGWEILLITPSSPLGSALVGKHRGDDFELDIAGGIRQYEIISVR
jgi:hypothetical protein